MALLCNRMLMKHIHTPCPGRVILPLTNLDFPRFVLYYFHYPLVPETGKTPYLNVFVVRIFFYKSPRLESDTTGTEWRTKRVLFVHPAYTSIWRTGTEVVTAEQHSPPFPLLRVHYSRFSNVVMNNRQSTCKYTITVQCTYLEQYQSQRKNGNDTVARRWLLLSQYICLEWLIFSICSLFVVLVHIYVYREYYPTTGQYSIQQTHYISIKQSFPANLRQLDV
jgi:hypothetical protein